MIYFGAVLSVLLKDKTELQNCYSTESSLNIYPGTHEFCITLVPTGSEECKVLPKGVRVSLIASLFATYSPNTVIYDFVYSSERTVCFSCNNLSNLPAECDPGPCGVEFVFYEGADRRDSGAEEGFRQLFEAAEGAAEARVAVAALRGQPGLRGAVQGGRGVGVGFGGAVQEQRRNRDGRGRRAGRDRLRAIQWKRVGPGVRAAQTAAECRGGRGQARPRRLRRAAERRGGAAAVRALLLKRRGGKRAHEQPPKSPPLRCHRHPRRHADRGLRAAGGGVFRGERGQNRGGRPRLHRAPAHGQLPRRLGLADVGPEAAAEIHPDGAVPGRPRADDRGGAADVRDAPRLGQNTAEVSGQTSAQEGRRVQGVIYQVWLSAVREQLLVREQLDRRKLADHHQRGQPVYLSVQLWCRRLGQCFCYSFAERCRCDQARAERPGFEERDESF